MGIAGFAFSPQNIAISVGDTVRWTNSDDAAHKVGSASGTSWTLSLGNGDSGTRTFDSAGTFDYRCLIHPGMTGTVTVNP